MELGALIGRGRTAEVYAFGPGRAVKLMLPGFSHEVLEAEAIKTARAQAAGVAAPAVHGRVDVDGRGGFVFDRVEGRVMLDVLARRPWRAMALADVLGDAHSAMHRCRSADLPDVKAIIAAKIEAARPAPPGLRRAALERLAGLEDGDRVVHMDYHPGNVMVTVAGPVVIDWLDAARGSPAADVARSLWLMSPATTPPGMPLQRTIGWMATRVRRRYLRRYREITGLDTASIHRWRLPIVVARLAEGIGHETDALLEEAARLVGPPPATPADARGET